MASNAHPLRPYFRRPDYLYHDQSNLQHQSLNNSSGESGGLFSSLSSKSSQGSKILSDLDYADYLELRNTSELVRSLTNAALLRYSATFLAQPFEVSKMVLQCGVYERSKTTLSTLSPSGTTASATAVKKPKLKPATAKISAYQSHSDDSYSLQISEEETELRAVDDDDEEVDYFSTTSSAAAKSPPDETVVLPSNSRRNHLKSHKQQQHKRSFSVTDSDYSSSASSTSSPSVKISKQKQTRRQSKVKIPSNTGGISMDPSVYQLRTHRPFIQGAMAALWTKDGPWGIWRGTNITFIQSIMHSTLDSWLTAFFSAVLSLPDPFVLDTLSDSPRPILSLLITLTSTTLTSLALAPLDIVRTKLILTPSDAQPRSIAASLQCLPTLYCPTHLVLPTILLSSLPKLVSRASPILFRARWGVDIYSAPVLYNMLSFAAGVLELSVRLPLETVLRRGQLAYVGVRRTLVPVGEYKGVLGTCWSVLTSEENGVTGWEGLWRGWRLGMLGVLGTWGFGGLRSHSLDLGREERF